MLQINDSVGSAVNGPVTAVVGSGITSMSLAWMGCQPRIEEPSKPRPSSEHRLAQLAGRYGEVLPDAEEVVELQIHGDRLLVLMNLMTSLAFIPSFLLLVLDGFLCVLAFVAVLRPLFLDGI